MKNKNIKKRWTIVNFPEDLKELIVQYAHENGYNVSRAIKELTKKELKKWKSKKDEQ